MPAIGRTCYPGVRFALGSQAQRRGVTFHQPGMALSTRFSAMSSGLSHGASGAIRRFAGWVARGSVGHPMLEGINYWDELRDSPSQMEVLSAIFANVLQLDEHGEPINEKRLSGKEGGGADNC